MNRKITRLARAIRCGIRGASGSTETGFARDSSVSIDASAREPNPTADRLSNWRRETYEFICDSSVCVIVSPDVDKFVGANDDMSQTKTLEIVKENPMSLAAIQSTTSTDAEGESEEEDWNSEEYDYSGAFGNIDWTEFKGEEEDNFGNTNAEDWGKFDYSAASGWNATGSDWWTPAVADDSQYWATEPEATEATV